jgi:hypothetical protein
MLFTTFLMGVIALSNAVDSLLLRFAAERFALVAVGRDLDFLPKRDSLRA